MANRRTVPSQGQDATAPVLQFVNGMAELCGQGLRAWQDLAGIGHNGASEPARSPMSAAVDQMQNLTKSLLPPPSGATSGGATGATALAQAFAAYATSGVRYASALAEIGARYQGRVLAAVADGVAEPEKAAMLARLQTDELRALLRCIGDAAALEARRFQLDLERIGESVAEAADKAAPAPHSDKRVRRHEVKP